MLRVLKVRGVAPKVPLVKLTVSLVNHDVNSLFFAEFIEPEGEPCLEIVSTIYIVVSVLKPVLLLPLLISLSDFVSFLFLEEVTEEELAT